MRTYIVFHDIPGAATRCLDVRLEQEQALHAAEEHAHRTRTPFGPHAWTEGRGEGQRTWTRRVHNILSQARYRVEEFDAV